MCWSRSRSYADGDIIVLGINTKNILAGHIEICVGTEWWAVCDDGWDSDDASAVCRRLGFTECKLSNPPSSHGCVVRLVPAALHCTNSCFGRSLRSRGIRKFQCDNNACDAYTRGSETDDCRDYAGIVYSKYGHTVIPPLRDYAQIWTENDLYALVRSYSVWCINGGHG